MRIVYSTSTLVDPIEQAEQDAIAGMIPPSQVNDLGAIRKERVEAFAQQWGDYWRAISRNYHHWVMVNPFPIDKPKCAIRRIKPSPGGYQ